MPKIPYPMTPEQILVFQAGLQHLVNMGLIAPDAVPEPVAHPIYTLGANHLGNATAPNEAILKGWRCFARTEKSPDQIVAADISAGSQPVLISTTLGKDASDEYGKLKEAETVKEVQADNYELRLLRIPAGLLQSFWVKPASSNGYLLPFVDRLIQVDQKLPYYVFEDYLRWVKIVDPILRGAGPKNVNDQPPNPAPKAE
jgi:hypothetical protein